MNEFIEFQKIPRLNRDVVITEKIDGTNAQILIEPVEPGVEAQKRDAVAVISERFAIYAGSRSRWLHPGQQDNFGFAAWVAANAEAIAALLGPGRHFGEWWGAGVQRKYGLTGKRFSLFNVSCYGEVTKYTDPRCLERNLHAEHKGVKVCACREASAAVKAEIGGVLVDSVPVLYRGSWFGTMFILDPSNTDEKPAFRQPRTGWAPALVLQYLATEGSQAAPGFMKPEGIVVFHEVSGQLFKVTLESDENPKGM